MIQLIYRKEETYKQNVSPFDIAINKLVNGKDILIACPYLGIDYFQEITTVCRSWKLLTDIKAWIESHLRSPKQLPLITQFIHENHRNIRHFSDLHAKVIISPDQAFVGSTNLTKLGIQEREEMAVLINEPIQVNELCVWFTTLWERTYELREKDLGTINEYILDYLQWEERNPIQKNSPLKLRKPKKIKFEPVSPELAPAENNDVLPIDISTAKVNGKQLVSVKDLAFRIASKETIQWISARRWIYNMIWGGKIQAYRFNNILLLDEEGAKEIWKGRSRIREGTHNLQTGGNPVILEVEKGQLLTIKDITSLTGYSAAKIRQFIENNIIHPICLEKLFVFESGVIEQIQSIPQRPKGRTHTLKPDSDIVILKPYTEAEKFILNVQDQGYSWQQLTDIAREKGLTVARSRTWSQLKYKRAIAKRELYLREQTSSEELEKTGDIILRKPRAGRPRKQKAEINE